MKQLIHAFSWHFSIEVRHTLKLGLHLDYNQEARVALSMLKQLLVRAYPVLLFRSPNFIIELKKIEINLYKPM